MIGRMTVTEFIVSVKNWFICNLLHRESFPIALYLNGKNRMRCKKCNREWDNWF